MLSRKKGLAIVVLFIFLFLVFGLTARKTFSQEPTKSPANWKNLSFSTEPGFCGEERHH